MPAAITLFPSSFTNPRAVNGLGSKTPTIGMPINEENRLLVYGGKLMNLAYSDGSEFHTKSPTCSISSLTYACTDSGHKVQCIWLIFLSLVLIYTTSIYDIDRCTTESRVVDQ